MRLLQASRAVGSAEAEVESGLGRLLVRSLGRVSFPPSPRPHLQNGAVTAVAALISSSACVLSPHTTAIYSVGAPVLGCGHTVKLSIKGSCNLD